MSQCTKKPTISLVRPAKTQISLHKVCAVWSESLLIVCVFYSLLAIQRRINENPCHTGWMNRLIRVFAGHTGLIVGFVVYLLICKWLVKASAYMQSLHEHKHKLYILLVFFFLQFTVRLMNASGYIVHVNHFSSTNQIKTWNDNTAPLSCSGQKTLSKIDVIYRFVIPNQISTISMHIPSLVKIHWYFSSYRLGMKIRTCGVGQIILSKIDDTLAIPNQIFTISMHIPSLVKIHWHLLSYHLEMIIRTCNGQITLSKIAKICPLTIPN